MLTINGKQKTFSINYSISSEHWDKKKQRVKNACADAAIINLRISQIVEKFNVLKLKSALEQKKLSVDEVREYLQGKQNNYTFWGVFESFVNIQEKRKDLGQITESTFKVWDYRKKSFELWFQYKKLVDVYLGNIERKDFEAMKLFFLSIGYELNYISKILEDFKRVLAYAVSEKLLNENVFEGLSISEKYDEPIFLSIEQLNSLIEKDFSNNLFYDKVRDFFLFVSYTGLHYRDYINLIEGKYLFLKIGVYGRTWIIGNRMKGVNQNYGKLALPLLEVPQKIISKYGGLENMPKMENQTFNRILKEIQKIMGFDVVLSCKIGRNTFAYISLNHWHLSMETVSRMLGHESTEMLKKYARINEVKIANDAKDLK